MKKFNRLFLSLCVVCLTLFNFSTSTKASTLEVDSIGVYAVGKQNTILSSVSGYLSSPISIKGTATTTNPIWYFQCNIAFNDNVPSGIQKITVDYSGMNTLYTKDVTIELYNPDYPLLEPLESSFTRNGSDMSVSATFDVGTSIGYSYIVLKSYASNVIDIGFSISATFNSISIGNDNVVGSLNNINSGISNIQSSISTINSDIVAINSNIIGVNNTLSQFESNIEEDFEQLRNTMSEESSNISNSISSFENSFIENISFVNEGIANAWKTSKSIESFVKQIIDLIQTTNSNLFLIYTDIGKWFSECIDWYDLILRQLINIQSQTVTNTNDLINALGAHDSALALNLSNLGNSLLSGMNTLNTDIQNQMITQTSNITNNIVAQTNALNSSIKTMENSVTTKLDDTLVIKDKASVDSNDSSTEELDSAITDYDNVEKDLVTDFNESLDAIDTDSSSSIYSQNDFINTAQFISTNMQNVYESNDFVGGMIDVTLLLGLIFTVIGIGVR